MHEPSHAATESQRFGALTVAMAVSPRGRATAATCSGPVPGSRPRTVTKWIAGRRGPGRGALAGHRPWSPAHAHDLLVMSRFGNAGWRLGLTCRVNERNPEGASGMPYRRIRSYRRRDARRYRSFEKKPRGRRAAMAGLLAVALIAGIGLLSAPQIRAMLSASSTAAATGACATTAAAAGPARTATSRAAAAPAVVDGSAVADSSAPSASATPAPAGVAGSSAAAPATSPATPNPNTASTAPAPAPDPTTSAPAPAPTTAPAQTTSPAPTPCQSSTATASPSATAAPPAANMDCVIIVPARPLTARGLATPYQLTGPNGASPEASGCTMANSANLGAFVQATILNPATGALSVYEPLVITMGTTPAAAPVVPKLPRGAVVTIDFGFNGTNLTQVGATPRALLQGHCVNGLPGSIFGQVSFCHGTAFFRAAQRAERRGKLVVRTAGISPVTGQAC